MNDDERQKLTLWRYAILGRLVSVRLEHGDLRELFAEAAAGHYEHPLRGELVQISARTIETWYYRYHADGLAGLTPRIRKDRGQARTLEPELVALILRAKRERPRRSVRRIIRILERARKVDPGQLSRSTVHRVLKHAGISTRPAREPERERRSFILEHAGDLWVGDVKHGPRVRSGGRVRKSYAINIIDCATRYVVASRMCLSECAVAHEGVLKEALRTYGRPCTYYVDRGAAYRSDSLKQICADLGIHHLLTLARDAEAKGVIERWQRTWGEEVLDELPDEPLELDDLQSKSWAWLARDYHARIHDTTQRVPLEHLLAELEGGHVRELPAGVDLDRVFWHRAERRVRKDGTVRFAGRLLEVQGELVGQRVELRWDPSEADPQPQAWLGGAFVCDTVELDRLRNASRIRRAIERVIEPAIEPTGLDPLADLEREHFGDDGDQRR